MDQPTGKGGIYARAILLIAILQGFLYVNAHVWWGPDWPDSAVTIYLFLEAIFFGWLGYGLVIKSSEYSWISVAFSKAVLMWMFGFALTWVVVYGLFTFLLDYQWPTIDANQALPLFMFHAVFVAPVEELIFRGVIPQEVEGHERWRRFPILLIGSQILFAVFHWGTYGGLGWPMLYAFMFGMVWVFASRRWSIYWTMGSHLAYNTLIIGILSGGIT